MQRATNSLIPAVVVVVLVLQKAGELRSKRARAHISNGRQPEALTRASKDAPLRRVQPRTRVVPLLESETSSQATLPTSCDSFMGWQESVNEKSVSKSYNTEYNLFLRARLATLLRKRL
jgi:hypothetical protein